MVQLMYMHLYVIVKFYWPREFYSQQLSQWENFGGNKGDSFFIIGLAPLVKTTGYPQQKTNRKKTSTKDWSPKDDIKEFPTNGFGHIKFTNAYNSSLKPAKVWMSVF